MSYFHAQQIEKRRCLLLVSSVFFFIYINFFFFFSLLDGEVLFFSEICSIFFLCLRHKLLIIVDKEKNGSIQRAGGRGERLFGEHKHGILSLKNDMIFFCIYHFIIYYYNNRGQFLFCLIFWKAKSDEILLLFFFFISYVSMCYLKVEHKIFHIRVKKKAGHQRALLSAS